jgi:hypothetical protein
LSCNRQALAIAAVISTPRVSPQSTPLSPMTMIIITCRWTKNKRFKALRT